MESNWLVIEFHQVAVERRKGSSPRGARGDLHSGAGITAET